MCECSTPYLLGIVPVASEDGSGALGTDDTEVTLGMGVGK